MKQLETNQILLQNDQQIHMPVQSEQSHKSNHWVAVSSNPDQQKVPNSGQRLRVERISDQTKNRCKYFVMVLVLTIIVSVIGKATYKSFFGETVQFWGPDQIRFCIVSVSLNEKFQHWYKNYESLFDSTYNNWQMVLSVKNEKQVQKRQERVSTMLKEQQRRVQFVESLGNKGKDYYNMIQNKCYQHSVVVILNEDETLVDGERIFHRISDQIQGRDPFYVWIYPFRNQEGQVVKSKFNLSSFRRSDHFADEYDKNSTIVQKYSKKRQLVENLQNHVRIFKREFYSLIAYIDIMYENQTFYQSQLSFIMPLLEMRDKEQPYRPKYGIVLPGKVIIRDDLILYQQNGNKKQEKSVQEMTEILIIGYKMEYRPLEEIVQLVQKDLYRRIPKNWQKSLRFNILDRNITPEEKIPKIVHQIWINNNKNLDKKTPFPPFKQRYMQKVKQVYKDYEYKLWTSENLTQENFPKTWSKIQDLLQLDKYHGYSRVSMVADLMKYELIYNNGGFYIDTNIEPFKSVDHLRHYPFVGVSQIQPQWVQYLAASFFGAVKHSKYMERLISQKNLAKIDIGGHPNFATGPGYIAQAFMAQDFLDIKILPPDDFYPFVDWTKDPRWIVNKCTYKKGQREIPQSIKGTYSEVIETNDYKIIYPCDKQYPGKYGIDHWNLGGSWAKPRL